MKRVCKNINFLRRLANAKSKQARKLLLQTATPDQLRSIQEIAINTCNGNIKLGKVTISKLKKHKTPIRHIAKKGAKKQYLIQKGGFLPIILPIIASLASSILGK